MCACFYCIINKTASRPQLTLNPRTRANIDSRLSALARSSGLRVHQLSPLFQDTFISRLRNSIVRHRAAFIPIFREKRETYRTRQAPAFRFGRRRMRRKSAATADLSPPAKPRENRNNEISTKLARFQRARARERERKKIERERARSQAPGEFGDLVGRLRGSGRKMINVRGRGRNKPSRGEAHFLIASRTHRPPSSGRGAAAAPLASNGTATEAGSERDLSCHCLSAAARAQDCK